MTDLFVFFCVSRVGNTVLRCSIGQVETCCGCAGHISCNEGRGSIGWGGNRGVKSAPCRGDKEEKRKRKKELEDYK